ncbi:RDD family protein [Candidatus Woesearchaeota archaeon]|nr:RDD family protein [Candidatus Woesearchaeota archaeon]
MKKLNLPEERMFVAPALLWKRIVAFLIDLLILFFIVFIPFRGFISSRLPKDYSFSETYKMLTAGQDVYSIIPVYMAMLLLMFLYFYLLERKMAQTIGKKLMNLYIVSDNAELKRWQALVRNLLFIPVFPFDLLIIIDPVSMLFTKTNQRLSELLSRTRVVEIHKFDQSW